MKKKKKLKKKGVREFFAKVKGFLEKYWKILLTVIIVLSLVVPFSVVRTKAKKFTYDGLGPRQKVEEAIFDMACFYQDEHNLRNYRDDKVIGVPGIDVSEHQGDINWKKVKKAGVKFAMVRLGYSSCRDGAINMDVFFEKNMAGTQKAGIDTGVYFFSQATTTDEALKEARFVVDNIKDRNVTMPVAFDMEPVTEDDRINGLSIKEKTEVADAFLTAVTKAGYKGMIYGNAWWIDGNFDLSYLTDYDLWLAAYGIENDCCCKYAMWQYADWGRIDGINTNVDLDIYFHKKGML